MISIASLLNHAFCPAPTPPWRSQIIAREDPKIHFCDFLLENDRIQPNDLKKHKIHFKNKDPSNNKNSALLHPSVQTGEEQETNTEIRVILEGTILLCLHIMNE